MIPPRVTSEGLYHSIFSGPSARGITIAQSVPGLPLSKSVPGAGKAQLQGYVLVRLECNVLLANRTGYYHLHVSSTKMNGSSHLVVSFDASNHDLPLAGKHAVRRSHLSPTFKVEDHSQFTFRAAGFYALAPVRHQISTSILKCLWPCPLETKVGLALEQR